jgi:hypothetical protein
VRILSLMGENLKMRAQAEAMGLSRSTERTGMYTTALVVKVGEQMICLYYSGCAPPPSVKPGANSGRGGRGLAPGPNVLNVPCIPRGPISGLRLNWR